MSMPLTYDDYSRILIVLVVGSLVAWNIAKYRYFKRVVEEAKRKRKNQKIN